MKLDNRYEIRIVIVEFNNQETGDVYDSLAEFKKEKPSSSYYFGFIVFDTESGFIPDNCEDWNESIEDAILDWQTNCI